MSKELTGTVDEKDGTLTIKDGEASIRYVKESDLLAVKGSKETAEKAARDATEALTATKASAESERQKALQAEASISSLKEQIARGGGTAAEVAALKAELETAKKSGEEASNSFLSLRRELVVKTYNVPVATVEKKSIKELEIFEEALKAVIGKGNAGNYAFGGGGGGQNLSGKSPMELAQLAYESSNKK